MWVQIQAGKELAWAKTKGGNNNKKNEKKGFLMYRQGVDGHGNIEKRRKNK